VWKVVKSTNDLEKKVINSDPVVPAEEIPSTLICPHHNGLFIEPVELPW
jgi:hypothetical protein